MVYPFPNYEPIISLVSSMGFTQMTEFKYYKVFVRDMGGIPYYLRIDMETASWDISDETRILHWLGPLPNDKFDYSTVEKFSSRKYYGTNDVPTEDQLKAIIISHLGYEREGAKKALLEAHENLKKAHARFVMSETFKW